MSALGAPRVVVAGVSGDAGKTMVSLALALAARDRGIDVRAFKKGPDYIDAAWLAWASGRPARNLDTFMAGRRETRRAFARHAAAENGPGAALNVIEGNRGLFDGVDPRGTHSTAALAELLDVPALVVVDARKMTATAAAIVRGCQAMAPRLRVGGVVLNRVSSDRHAGVAREAIEGACGVPVLGAIPRLGEADLLPGRHLGLVTPDEHGAAPHLARRLRAVAREYLDVDRILACAAAAPPLDVPEGGADQEAAATAAAAQATPVTVGYLRDAAFSFYYPENLEALAAHGASLVPLSSLSGEPIPRSIDALYIGGGFPETHAAAIARNRALIGSLRDAAAEGLPVYAECGGLMLLARSIGWRGDRHQMAGALAIDVDVLERPQGHGYMVLSVDRPNPFFGMGLEIRAHEFHYSRIVGATPGTACAVTRGTGCGGGRDAVVTRNVWASYAHVHALATPEWAGGVVAAAGRFAARRAAGARGEGGRS